MIRKACINDIDAIWELYEKNTLNISRVDDIEYATSIQKNGFIVFQGTKMEVQERISSSRIFDIFEDTAIAGFIDVDKKIYFPEDADNIVWSSDILKNIYFHDEKAICLHFIAVDCTYKEKGVAKQLFNNAFEVLKNEGFKHIFSIVTLSPLTNCPSVIWHSKMGFRRVCITMPIDLFGLKDYMSLLFYKEIK